MKQRTPILIPPIPTLIKHVTAPVMTSAWLETIWLAVQRCVAIPRQSQLSVVVVGDKSMIKLNTQYRKVAAVTDVLSFRYGRTEGEIVICYPQAKRQAKAKQQTLQHECAWLIVHGILHWLGYDHESAKDAQLMRPLEQDILAYV